MGQLDPRVLLDCQDQITPVTETQSLAPGILCVAQVLPGERWEARIGTVADRDHVLKQAGVLKSGVRLPETVALAIFRRWPKNAESYAE